jgi:hypothetical protein
MNMIKTGNLRVGTALVITTAFLLFASAPMFSIARGQTYWTGHDSNDFTDAGNWSNGAPASGDPVLDTSLGSITLSLSESSPFTYNVDSLTASGGNMATLTIASGNILSVNGGSSVFSYGTAITGGTTLSLNGAGELLSTDLHIGGDGTTASSGTLQQSSGTLSITNQGIIGDGGTGVYSISGGTGTFNGGILLAKGASSSGSLDLSGTGVVQVGGTNGISSGGGTAVINGAGGQIEVIGSDLSTSVNTTLASNTRTTINTNGLNATFNGNIANDASGNGGLTKIGTGNLTLNGSANTIASFYTVGGTVTQNTGSGLTAYEVSVGYGTGNSATYDMTGGTLVMATGTPPHLVGGSASSLRIGDFGGTGVFDQTGGSVTANGSFNVGSNGGNGTYDLSGGSLTITNGSVSDVAYSSGSATSTGAINLSGTGSMSLEDGTNLILSNRSSGPGGTGVFTQTGGTLSVDGTSGLFLTGSGSGTYNLNGGTLEIGGTSLVGNYNNAGGTYAFNGGGGTIEVTGSDLTTDVNMTLDSGTRTTINTNGLNATFNGNITNDASGNGGLTKIGTGNLTLNGSANTIASFYTAGGTVTQNTGSGLTAYELSVGYGTGDTTTYDMTGGTLVMAAGSTPPLVGGSASSLRIGDFGGTGVFDQTGGSVTANGSLNVGSNGGNGTYDLSAGSLTITNSSISNLAYSSGSATSTGAFNLSGTGSMSLQDSSYLILSNRSSGPGGTGVFTQTGGTFSVDGTSELILTGSGTGTYNLNGGTLEIGGTSLVGNYNNAGGTYAFNGGGGTIQVTGSDLNTAVNMTLDSGTRTTVNTNGLNATFTGNITNDGSNNGGLTKIGAGNLTLAGSANSIASFYTVGGTVTQNTGSSLTAYEVSVGYGTGNSATYDMTGGSLVMAAGSTPPLVGGSASSLRIGDFGGTGVFDQTGGSVTANGSFNVGSSGGNGTYDLSGGSLTITNGSVSDVAYTAGSTASTGTINLSGTGSMSLEDGTNLILSNRRSGPGGTGTFTQTGGTMSVDGTSGLFLTGGGMGTYNLDGGTLEIGGSSLQGVYNNGGGTYAFNMDGGTVVVEGTALNTAVNMDLGATSTINTNNLGATFSGSISGTGGINQEGSGTLTLSGNSSYSGNTTVNGGALDVASSTAAGTGTIVLAGGELTGSSEISNDIELTLNTSTIAGTAGQTLTLDGSLTFDTSSWKLNIGDSVNTGTVGITSDLPVGANTVQIASGATLDNGGSVELAGGQIAGSGSFTNDGTISGTGTIKSAFTNKTDGIVAAGTGNLKITQNFTNQGVVDVTSVASLLSGGKITNQGQIEGIGNVQNAIDNSSGTISPTGGTLDLTGAVTNDAQGEIASTVGTEVVVGQGLGTNAGLISLSGGDFNNNNHLLTNTGEITGFGTMNTGTGGLATTGILSFAGGTTTVDGAVAINGGTVDIYDTTNFNNAVTINGGTTTTHSANAVFAEGLSVNGGSFFSDPSVTTTTNLNVGANGSIGGGAGSIYRVTGDVNNQSSQDQLATTEIEIVASGNSGNGQHSFTWSAPTGLADQIGNLTIDSGQTVQTQNTENGVTGELAVNELQLTYVINASNAAPGGLLSDSVLTADVDQVFTAGNLDIYYNVYNPANSYLQGQNISYGDGGEILALVPEPSTWALLVGGLALLGLQPLRRLRAGSVKL